MSPELPEIKPVDRKKYLRPQRERPKITPSSFFIRDFESLPWREAQISAYAEVIKEPGSSPHWLTSLENYKGGIIYGGYLEDRSRLFDDRHDAEALIHLGIDFWMPAGSQIRFPLNGEVLSATPAREDPTDRITGGWGGRLDILAENRVWIFGHLRNPEFQTGEKITPGQIIGVLGSREENGGWLPHLHIQCASLEEYRKFPNPREMDAYARPSNDLKDRYPNPLA